MKKIVTVFGICILLAAGCGRSQETANHLFPERVRGEWVVVNVNCPQVLAERLGERRRFMFHPAEFATWAVRPDIAASECHKVTPGWIVWVEADRVSFFPPIKKGVK